jgi:signal transduction histidine kinase
VEQCFYRVAQEALENISQHANAKKVSISMRQQAGMLALKIHDDGRGFNSRAINHEKRLGIKGMQERAELINAHLDIDSRPEGGTTITLEWGTTL